MKEENRSNNVLFVYHRLDVIGGIETRFIDEFKYLKNNGFNNFLFTDRQKINSELLALFPECRVISEPVGDLSKMSNLIELVEILIHYIEKHQITLICVHMLNWFAFAGIMAAQLTRVPVISTTHGILEVFERPINRLFLQYFTSKSISLQIYVSNLPKFGSIPSLSQNSVKIPNLIDLTKYCNHNVPAKKWLMVSRVSPEKYPSIMAFVELANYCNIHEVDIVGGGDTNQLIKLINKNGYKIKVNFLGQYDDMPKLMQQYEVIVGMGRVAIEALACKIKACIITPDGKLKGLVLAENFRRNMEYNFTGNTLKTITAEEFKFQLANISVKDMEKVYQLLTDNLSSEKWNEYIHLYKQAKFIDNPALSSLFHKMSYFEKNISQPFEKDEFLQFILEEVLIEHKLYDEMQAWDYYKSLKRLRFTYPNPYKAQKKKSWKF